jgi:hypothetical protein
MRLAESKASYSNTGETPRVLKLHWELPSLTTGLAARRWDYVMSQGAWYGRTVVSGMEPEEERPGGVSTEKRAVAG